MKAITFDIKWHELFYLKSKNKARWEEWKRVVKALEPEHDIEFFEDGECCEYCMYFDCGWCNLQQLPSAFNPVTKCLGMACMGMGKKEKELTLFDV